MRSPLIVVSVAAALSLSACSSGPDASAEAFLKAAYQGHSAEAIEHVDPSVRQAAGAKMMAALEVGGRKAASMGGLKTTNVVEKKTEGDYSTVKVDLTYGNGTKATESLKMRKVDGEWYVTF